MSLPGPLDDISPVSWQRFILERAAQGAHQDAWALCHQAITQHPDSAELLVQAATLLMKFDQPAEAERYIAKAAALHPGSAVIKNNLGLALRNQNRVLESLECFDAAIRLDPTFARGHYDRAFALLLLGDYGEGFPEYEHRWKANGQNRPGDDDRAMLDRLWRGSDPTGKRLLIYTEQGLGDTIQFVRYVSRLKEGGAEVVLKVQPLLQGLVHWLRPACEIANGGALERFDLHCPLMTLPLLFGTTPETVPPPAVFEVPKEMRAKWRTIIAPTSDRLQVGVVWAGNPENPMDDRRSTSLETFHSILAVDELQQTVRFFSLQIGPRGAEIEAAGGLVRDLRPNLQATTDTAAALTQLDLVITVDTFVAHLAATLGRPVWLMLPFAPDWRWMLSREDSPWYPSIRLFRQSAPGDWNGVAGRVRQALGEWIKSRATL